jgi:hypothetical protein
LPITDIVRFDERDNAYAYPPCNTLCIGPTASLPATSSHSTSSFDYPFLTSNEVAGWMYLNINNGGSTGYSVTRTVSGFPTIITGPGSTSSLAPNFAATTGPRPSQNWVTITMFGSFGTKHLVAEFDAASLGNGCSPASRVDIISPTGGVFVCPPGTSLANGTTDLCTGTNINPRP